MLNNRLALIFITCAIANCVSIRTQAQIIPDRTLGNESSTVREDIVNGIDSDLIEGGANRGANLFHSFEEFNIDLGRGAYFANPAAIQNIFTRVTGGNASNLQGVLGVLGNANLFLINPNGIIFGDNASLDLNGSFFASTADSILFEDLEFSADNPQAIPSVTINIPIGLGFRDEPGDINLAGNLTVSPEQTISLVGGDLNLNSGQIDSPQSNIFLGSVTEAGIVDLDTSFTPNILEDLARGDIFLSNARVSVRGDIGGNITIDTGNLELSESSFILNGIESSNNPLDARAGDTNINATGRVTISNGSVVSNLTRAETIGNAGNINIFAGSFELSDSPFPLDTSANGTGDAGDINITVQGNASIQNTAIFTSIFTPGTIGDGGDLNINVIDGSLEITDSSLFSDNTAGTGNAGNIAITAEEITLNNSNLDGRTENIGNAGNINVNADRLELNNSDILSGVSSSGEGNGGNIAIATNSLNLTQDSSLSANSAGIGNAGNIDVGANSIVLDGDETSISSAVVSTSEMGNGGDITIETDSLELIDGAFITSRINSQTGNSGNIKIVATDFVRLEGGFLPSSIENSTSFSNTGNAGKINIEAGSLDVFDGDISSEVAGEGESGGITINVDENIRLDGSFSNGIFTTLLGTGQAGDITINAKNLELSNGTQITSSIIGTANGDAGDITLNIQEEIIVNRFSGVFSDVLIGGIGNGGDININTVSLRLTDLATINSRTAGEGNAGNLKLNISNNLELNNSEIRASTGDLSTGNGGDIQITTTSVFLNNDSEILVNSLGAGDAGNIEFTTDNLTSDNSLISAETVSGEGGNLTFNLTQDLVLDNSAIETEAGGSGNGGNITTNADFIILENSSFIANAFEGDGGNIDLTIQNLFTTLDSTISASSQFGIDGIIEINTPDVDPSQGVIELPQTVVDPDRLIAENACKQGTNSQFYLTGRGGLPPNPSSSLDTDTNNIDVDLIEPIKTNTASSQTKEQIYTETNINSQNVTSASIVPARGWIKNERGEVMLVSHDPDNSAIARDREFVGSCNRK